MSQSHLSQSHLSENECQTPPTRVWAILGRLGPGLIVAGSIVGSGELIATTKTGAEAGFWLLWLILIGCIVKVFAQVEFGRFSIVTGQTTMDGLAQVPGPHWPGHGNWIVWYWFLMFLASISQLGGIVGAVGQAMSISIPLTAEGRAYNDYVTLAIQKKLAATELERIASQTRDATDTSDSAEIRRRAAQIDAELARRNTQIIAQDWCTAIQGAGQPSCSSLGRPSLGRTDRHGNRRRLGGRSLSVG